MIPFGVQGSTQGCFCQSRHIEGVEAIHILLLTNPCDHLIRIDMFRQRQLDQNSVHRIVGIEVVDNFQQLLLRNVRRLANRRIQDTDLVGSLRLTRHIGYAARILTDQHHYQMGQPAVFLRECLHLLGHLGLASRR